jgi:hypothetical protein
LICLTDIIALVARPTNIQVAVLEMLVEPQPQIELAMITRNQE